ncbi:MAG: PqqD family protein [Acidobacteriota bacterium]
MTEWKPRSRPGVHARSTRRQRMLYDSASNTFHVLNETAEFIWELCDGKHTVEEMEQEISANFEVPRGADVRTDLENTLLALERKALLLPR